MMEIDFTQKAQPTHRDVKKENLSNLYVGMGPIQIVMKCSAYKFSYAHIQREMGERENGNEKRNGKISGPLCRNVNIIPHALEFL